MHVNDDVTSQEIAPRQWAALILRTLTGVAAVVLAARAIAGAFDLRVHAVIPCLSTVTALLASLSAWHLHESSVAESSPQRRLLRGFLSLVPAAVIGFSVSVNASPVALGITTGLLSIGLVTVVVAEAMRSDAQTAQSIDSRTDGQVDESAIEHARNGPEAHALAETSTFAETLMEHDSSANVEQRIVRRHNSDGTESIEAELVAVFAAGERETAVHLPIHPVVAGIPVVECEPLDASDVTVTVSTVQPYGVRLQVKRNGTFNEALKVPIGIAVQLSGNMSDVA